MVDHGYCHDVSCAAVYHLLAVSADEALSLLRTEQTVTHHQRTGWEFYEKKKYL